VIEESDSVAEYAADRARERRVDREQERQEQPGNQHARAAQQQATDGTASIPTSPPNAARMRVTTIPLTDPASRPCHVPESSPPPAT